MSKIESLTDEQWKRIYAARDEYVRIGTCTEPADRPMAEQAIRDMYRAIGKGAPKFIWVDGPLSMCVTGTELKDQVGCQFRVQLRDQGEGGRLNQLRGQLRAQLRDRLRNQLWNQLRGQLSDQLESQLGNQLGEQLRGQLRVQLRNQLENQLWGQIEDQLRNQLVERSLCGQEQIWWTGHYLTCREIVGVDYTYEQSKKLDTWIRLAKSCGWWLPYEGVCIVSERYKSVSFDDDRRLHCETGPAIECRDGYTVYAWHGMPIPGEWIENRDSLDPSTALTWENIEQRRAAAEIIGWDRVLDQLENRLIDSDEDPMIGDLIEVDLPDAEATRFLRVRCGTGRTFAIPVPPEYNTALEANAATYGVEPSLLRQMDIRT